MDWAVDFSIGHTSNLRTYIHLQVLLPFGNVVDWFGPPLWHFGYSLANGKFESVIQGWGVEVQFYISPITQELYGRERGREGRGAIIITRKHKTNKQKPNKHPWYSLTLWILTTSVREHFIWIFRGRVLFTLYVYMFNLYV